MRAFPVPPGAPAGDSALPDSVTVFSSVKLDRAPAVAATASAATTTGTSIARTFRIRALLLSTTTRRPVRHRPCLRRRCGFGFERVEQDADLADRPEAEPPQDRARRLESLDDERGRAAPDGLLPARGHERAVGAAPPRLGQRASA